MFGLTTNQIGLCIVAVLAVLWGVYDAGGFAWLGKFKLPTWGGGKAKIDPSGAFAAVQVLIAHYEASGCAAGLAAAREAGKHLFDAPGEVHR